MITNGTEQTHRRLPDRSPDLDLDRVQHDVSGVHIALGKPIWHQSLPMFDHNSPSSDYKTFLEWARA